MVKGLNQDRINLAAMRSKEPFIALRRLANAYQQSAYSDFTLYQDKAGYIHTSSMVYCIARDTRTDRYHIFFSRDADLLKCKKDKNGIRRFDGVKYRYRIPYSLPSGATEQEIRLVISAHHHDYIKKANNLATSSGGNLTALVSPHLSEEEQSNPENQIIGFTNDGYGLSIRKNSLTKKWHVNIHSPVDVGSLEDKYVEIDNLPIPNTILQPGLTGGATIAECDSQAEAMAMMDIIDCERSQLNWKGMLATFLKDAPLTKATTRLWNKFRSDFRNKSIRTSIGANLLIGMVSYVAMPAFGIVRAVLMTASMTYVGSQVGNGIDFAAQKALWAKDGVKGVYPIDYEAIEDTEENCLHRQTNMRVNPDMDQHLEVLSGEQIDITTMDRRQIHPRKREKVQVFLASYDSKGFSRRVNNINLDSGTEMSYNGLVRLTYKDRKTGNFISYAKYVPELNLNKRISLPARVFNHLAKNKVVRVEQQKGLIPIKISTASLTDIEEEIFPRLFENAEDASQVQRTAATDHIRWLFKDRAAANNNEEPTGQNKPAKEHIAFYKGYVATIPYIPESFSLAA